ncbi:MAG: hypothetical protein NC320_05485 [Clostridium sp.]|nr:hypothetical protein [Clostridium sp.]MCM1547353.1 hypothetical protein [Ruminococcus sp.]
MELMKKLIISACFLSIVISLADMLKPGEKFTRQLKMIFSLIFISGIILSVANSDFEFELPTAAAPDEIEGYKEIESAADKAVLEAAETSVNDMICRILTTEGISFEKISAVINMNDDGSINIIEVGYCGEEYDRALEAIVKNFGQTEVKRLEQ